MIVTRKNLAEAKKKAPLRNGLLEVQSICPFTSADGRDYIILACEGDIAFALWSDVKYFKRAKKTFNAAVEDAKLIYCKFSDRAPFFSPVFDEPGTADWQTYLEGHALNEYLETLEMGEEDFFGESGEFGEDLDAPVAALEENFGPKSKTKKK